MKIERMYVATQRGAFGQELVAYGHDRTKVIADLHQQAENDKANAYAHEQNMTHRSEQAFNEIFGQPEDLG